MLRRIRAAGGGRIDRDRRDAAFEKAVKAPPTTTQLSPPQSFPVYQGVEWQCRYVFPDMRCCRLPINHAGDCSPEPAAADLSPK